jgi:diaminohydroxyphosphoribosylaminopyrimidine deaminase/5-amino-6-(5-phosphoribosylamino)uracil reductase
MASRSAEAFMRLALEEARRMRGRTSPNPTVGAVLVKGGRVIARGHHRKAGQPHAEVAAIRRAGDAARGADLYTTLEPCDHYGRTPPCTLAILEAGVRQVICASSDPNPLVNGKGIARLRRAGIPVRTGVLRAEADQLNQPFFKYVRTGLPWVTLKSAISLDGKIATATGDSRWITGQRARAWAHRLRDQVDAIVVGANTVRLDNPRLTTRLPRGGGHNPVRVVVDSRLRLSAQRAVFAKTSRAPTIVATLQNPSGLGARRLRRRGVEVLQVQARGGRIDLEDLLHQLGGRGMLHLLVEGGAQLHAGFLRQGLADELVLFIAPSLIGGDGLSWMGGLGVRRIKQAIKVRDLAVERVGEDLLVRARVLRGRARSGEFRYKPSTDVHRTGTRHRTD